MARGAGLGRLLEGSDYFKCFRQRGLIIRGRQLIEGRLLFEEIRYFEIWDELSVHDRVIFKGQRWIIPQTLRQKIKQKLHDSHIGSQGCLCRAQETVYWPGMNAKITDYIQKCKVCMSLQSNQTKEPLICHKPTSRPREKVATDIFTLDDKNCLCTVNYYSGYFEVDQLHSKTVTVIIKKLKRHFVTNGTPNELLSVKATWLFNKLKDYTWLHLMIVGDSEKIGFFSFFFLLRQWTLCLLKQLTLFVQNVLHSVLFGWCCWAFTIKCPMCNEVFFIFILFF